MSTDRIRAGVATWASSDKAARNRNGTAVLKVEDTDAYAYIAPAVLVPAGATITSATLSVFAAEALTGTRTMSVVPVGASWKPSQLTWNDKPTTSGATVTVNANSLAVDAEITFDVTAFVQSVVNGSDFFGWRLSTSDATRRKIHSFNSSLPPRLTVAYTLPPAVPTSLVPGGGAVGASKPVVSWQFSDPDGDALSSIRVQVDAAMNGATPSYDSGWKAATVPELDLNTTTSPTFPALTSGATTYWRANQQAGGQESGWSDWHELRFVTKGTLSITAPSGSTITSATPTVTWSLTGATQAAWQLIVTRSTDAATILYDTGVMSSATTSWTLPPGVVVDESWSYKVTVWTWDTVTREATPGVPTYSEASKTLTVADGATGAPTGITATPDPVTPAVVVGWTNSGTNDFEVVRDGSVVAVLDNADAKVSGSSYAWTDWTAQPLVQHSYQVRAVSASNIHSPRSAAATATPAAKGVWLVDPDTGTRFGASDVGGVDSWTRADSYAVYQPLGATKPVKITSAMAGLSGEFAGEIYAHAEFPTVASQVASVHALAERPDKVLRLVVGDRNIPVVVADLSVGIHSEVRATRDRARVSFKFWQYGELSFTPRF